MLLLLRYFGLAFGALLPVVNPLGSSLIFFGLVGLAPVETYRALARRIAISTVLFLIFVEFVGSALLAFLNISLPVVQLAGGLVLAAMGWRLLDEKDAKAVAQQPPVGWLGATVPGLRVSEGTALAMEVLLTAGLVNTILGTASGARNIGTNGAIAVGGYIALAGLWAAPISAHQ